jgi:hypothetical protein
VTSAAHNIEREREIAWRRHEPLRARVPFAARRAATAFREGLADGAARIKAVYQSPPFRTLLHDWALKKGVGRETARQKIIRMFTPASVADIGGELRLLWLEPRGPMVQIDDPRFAQDCVLVIGALVRRVGRKNVNVTSFPVLETPDHALARTFERSPDVNAREALIEAACAFLAADVEVARLRGATLCLPAANGLLLTEALLLKDLKDEPRLVARATTFITDAMAEPDQRPIAAAVDAERSVLAAAVGGGAPNPKSAAQ